MHTAIYAPQTATKGGGRSALIPFMVPTQVKEPIPVCIHAYIHTCMHAWHTYVHTCIYIYAASLFLCR